MAGVNMVHVPYRGQGPALTDDEKGFGIKIDPGNDQAGGWSGLVATPNGDWSSG